MQSAKWEWVKSTLINVICKLDVIVFNEKYILFVTTIIEKEIRPNDKRDAKQEYQQ